MTEIRGSNTSADVSGRGAPLVSRDADREGSWEGQAARWARVNSVVLRSRACRYREGTWHLLFYERRPGQADEYDAGVGQLGVELSRFVRGCRGLVQEVGVDMSEPGGVHSVERGGSWGEGGGGSGQHVAAVCTIIFPRCR